MARLSTGAVVTSPPVRTFPNGDYFFIEMARRNGLYDCLLKMAPASDPAKSFTVVRVKGKTIREAQENCYAKAVEKCPMLPRPPYLKRGRTE